MSGALNQVFGGGAGGILGAALNIGSMFFPPLAIANAVGNMVAGGLGEGIKGALDQLTQGCGMPKFIGDMVKGLVDKVVQGHMQPSDPACSDHVREKCGSAVDKFSKDFMSDFMDSVKQHKADFDRGQGCGKGEGKGGAGKGWFVALMTALGELQNKQADKLQKLQKEVSESIGSGDESSGSKQSQFDKMEEFKAEGKLMDVLSQLVKSIGDSLSQSLATVARAQ
jgi:hypothetical protein